MNRKWLLVLLTWSSIHIAQAQKKSDNAPAVPPVTKPPAGNIVKLSIDSSVTTSNTITIKGQRVMYNAIAGSIPIWDDSGKPLAGIFYTYYERTDVGNRAS